MSQPRFFRTLRMLCITVLAVTCAAAAQAQAYPARPVRIIVPATPAGPSDIMARALAGALTESMGQSFIVENKPGANGWIAYEYAAKAPPDGYTLVLAGTSQMAVQESLMSKVPYDTVRDFTFISNIGAAPSLLVVPPALPAQSLKELIAMAKASPGMLSYANPSPGSANHLASELLNKLAGIDVMHIPYKGAAPAEIDLLGNRVTFMFHTLPASLPRVRSGQMRAIAVSSATRSRFAPDVPTVAESGLPGFEVTTGFGLMGPQGLPREITERLNRETNKALHNAAFKEKLATLGIQEAPGTAADYMKAFRDEKAKWQKVVQDTGVKLDSN
ncbi:MAG TPA: tripartite tricarboxylate transporter substrate binding protein [Ramlibacter sp.]|nr:tripartite tricarboxylate transporter substrate binding protein [Ramlibacter sp.]